MLTAAEIKARTDINDVNIAAYSIPHADHTRIVYFDDAGQYLGDTIAFPEDDLPEIIQLEEIPFYIINQKNRNIFQRLRQMITERLQAKDLTITITGPSRAGKTSLVRYLQTLVPVRESRSLASVPTMGKSTKRVQLGRTVLKTLDMGGQQDFWNLWEEPISSSDAIIFIFDGTSNNILEIAQAFEKMIGYRSKNIPVLVIQNKKDLLLRGQAIKFTSSGEFLSLTKLSLPLPNVQAIEASIFEGIAYLSQEEFPLAEILSSFLREYC